jgi:methyl-accepting chemotaxis protein
VSILFLNDMREGIEKIGHERMNKVLVLGDIQVQLQRSAKALRSAIVAGVENPEALAAANEETANTSVVVRERIAALKGEVLYNDNNVKLASDASLKLMDEYVVIRKRYLDARVKVVNAVNAGNRELATQELQSKEFIESEAGYVKVIKDLSEVQVEEASFLIEESIKRALQAKFLLFILLAVGLLIAIIVSVVISRAIVLPVKRCYKGAVEIAKGNTNVTFDTKGNDEIAILSQSMDQMAKSINGLVKDIQNLSINTANGQLDVRMKPEDYQGDFQAIATGLNETVEAIIEPFFLTAEYVDRISKGDMPPLVEKDLKGDYNEIKTNVNRLVESINILVSDSHDVADALNNGILDKRADANRHQGDFKKIMEGLNSGVESVAVPFGIATDFLNQVAMGIEFKLDDREGLKGAYKEMQDSVLKVANVMYKLVETMSTQSKATINGQLDVRADLSGLDGIWNVIFEDFNKSFDALVAPLNMMAEYIDRISKGDMPPMITDEYRGDFNEIKTNVNTCIGAISGMVSDVESLINAAKSEEFETRADAEIHFGDFRSIVGGINEILNIVVEKIFWYEQLLDSMPFPISVTDMDMNWTFVNKAAADVTGKERKDVIGMQCSNWGADICGTEDCGIECIRRGQQTSFFTQPGMDVDFQVDTSYLTDINGDRIGHIEIVQDISKVSRSTNYNKVEIQRLSENLKLIASGDLNIDANIQEKTEYTAENHANFTEIYTSMNELVGSINNLMSDTGSIVENALDGNLKHRLDVDRHNGEFRKIIEGLNATLDAFVTPFDEASNILAVMATGDLTSEMTGEYSGQYANLKNDINKLSSSLNSMVSQVNETVATTASSAMEISSTSETLAAASQEMNSQADDVAAAVEEMARTVTENAQGATKTSAMAMENAHVAEEGGQVVQETVQKMGDIAKVVEETAVNIQKLGESSKAIGEIVSVIDDIADQTNLLALNASIEAARAGEQGRGFAVVADEVRKLAEKTVDATKEIASQITGIQKETASAVEAMNQGTQEVESGMKLAQSAGEALEKVLTSSNDVTQMITDIAAASEQQAATTEEISKNVIGISHATAESTTQVEAVAGTTEELTRLTEQLNDLMSQFKVDDEVRGLLN